MLDQIISVLRNEDTFKFFTGNAHPTIYDAVSAISNPHEHKEIERALKNYFDQVMQISPPESQMFLEANRMYAVCEGFFSSQENSKIGKDRPEVRDLNDEILEFYSESLKHFASFLNEDILVEHIKYLDNDDSQY